MSSVGYREGYDALPYDSRAIPQAHIERMAVLGCLHGHEPVDVQHCRVLELGAADGAHLLPMAVAYPESRFVGVDISPVQIERGRARAAALGLGNVELLVGDVAALPESLGQFDYIVAHGFYSWVPADVRDAAVRSIAERLTECGLAYVSYKTYPGSFAGDAARNLLASLLPNEPSARALRVRELSSNLHAAIEPRVPAVALLKDELRILGESSDSAINHDWFEPTSEAVYFRDFAAHLARYQLSYLCEAIPGDDLLNRLPRQMQDWIAFAGGNAIERQQALDLLLGRRIRHSIIRHGAATHRAPHGTNLLDFHVSSRAKYERKPSKVVFRAPTGAVVELVEPVASALVAVIDRAPEFVPVREVGRAFPGSETQQNSAESSSTLRALYDAGAIEFRVHAPRCVATPSARPFASGHARLEASSGEWVTNQHHFPVRVTDATTRRILSLCDGQRSVRDLARELGTRAKAQEAVGEMLQQLARFALLEA